MFASRRGFLAGFGSLLAAPAIVRADSLMKLHHIPERYATVWGIGHDYEVIEHVLWEPTSVAQFSGAACNGGHIEKFLEVTDWVYSAPVGILDRTLPRINPTQAFFEEQRRELVDWGKFNVDMITDYNLERAEQEWFVKESKAIVNEATGFTNVAGYWELSEWQASQRPDLEPPGSMDWAYESIRMEILTEPTQGRWFGTRSV